MLNLIVLSVIILPVILSAAITLNLWQSGDHRYEWC